MKGVAVFFSSITLLFGAINAQAQQKYVTDWELASDDDGIKAECREHQSGIEQCRFTLVTDLPVSALAAINVDPDNLDQWMTNVVTADKIEPSASTFDYHVHTTFNFPGAKARDAVTHTTAKLLPDGGFELVFKTTKNKQALENAKDVYEKYVRFPAMKGLWRFTPRADGKTNIYYENIALPGGYVQKFLKIPYNIGTFDASIDTIKNMLKEARKPKYMNAKLDQLAAQATGQTQKEAGS